ncbi:hypothetical protein Tco_0377625 [Tanacetum coccineum]
MLDKDLYDSWKSRMELYMQNREHGRMILESVEHGPLIWPMVEENGLPTDIYSLVNHHRVAKDLWERVQLLMQGTSLTKQEREFFHLNGVKFVTDVKLVKDLHTSNFDQLHAYLEQHELHANEVLLLPQAPTQLMTESPFGDTSFAVPVFSPGDDLIGCLNKAMAFLMAVASLRFPSTNNQLRTSSNLRNQATIQDGEGQKLQKLDKYWMKSNSHFLQIQEFPAESSSDYHPEMLLSRLRIRHSMIQIVMIISIAQAVLMANISNYGSDIISEKKRVDQKCLKKAKDPEVIAKKTSHKPIDYENLNSLTDDFGKHFSPQQELSAEQAFWFQRSNIHHRTSTQEHQPVHSDVPIELPKGEVWRNASLKKLKFHLTQFDFACKYATRIQELLVYVQDTCPNAILT